MVYITVQTVLREAGFDLRLNAVHAETILIWCKSAGSQ